MNFKTTETQRLRNKEYHARMKNDPEYLRKRRERAREYYHKIKTFNEPLLI